MAASHGSVRLRAAMLNLLHYGRLYKLLKHNVLIPFKILSVK